MLADMVNDAPSTVSLLYVLERKRSDLGAP